MARGKVLVMTPATQSLCLSYILYTHMQCLPLTRSTPSYPTTPFLIDCNRLVAPPPPTARRTLRTDDAAAVGVRFFALPPSITSVFGTVCRTSTCVWKQSTFHNPDAGNLKYGSCGGGGGHGDSVIGSGSGCRRCDRQPGPGIQPSSESSSSTCDTQSAGGITYGSVTQPVSWGSAGANAVTFPSTTYTTIGGSGGGSIRLVASTQLALNGKISADGDPSPLLAVMEGTLSANGATPTPSSAYGTNHLYQPKWLDSRPGSFDKYNLDFIAAGGGSGGSVWTTVGRLIGGAGVLSANGGAGSAGCDTQLLCTTTAAHGGGGGCGRVALSVDEATIVGLPIGRVTAAGGSSGASSNDAATAGTISWIYTHLRGGSTALVTVRNDNKASTKSTTDAWPHSEGNMTKGSRHVAENLPGKGGRNHGTYTCKKGVVQAAGRGWDTS